MLSTLMFRAKYQFERLPGRAWKVESAFEQLHDSHSSHEVLSHSR